MGDRGDASSEEQRVLPQAVWNKCIKMVDYAVKNSPRVKSLLRKIDQEHALHPSTCPPLSESGAVVCEDAFGAMPVGGAYDVSRRAVVMNPAAPAHFLTQSEFNRAVTHELIHAYDDCRAHVDWSSCAHLACAEVRAANLSGDCDFSVEMGRRPLAMLGGSWAGHQQQCVRRRAEKSLAQHAQCTAAAMPRRGARGAAGGPGEGGGEGGGGGGGADAAAGGSVGAGQGGVDKVVKMHVAGVWDECYKDTAPFSTN